MKALLLKGIRELAVEDVSVAPVGPKDVKIRVKRGLFCGTVHSMFTGAYLPPGNSPFFIGHEIAGWWKRSGQGMKDLAHGQTVVSNPVDYFHECYKCRIGQEHFGERLIENYHPMGSFSAYIVVHRGQVHAIP
jgi:D-arabinose 1-dehydrogenase-like Zn-dependent alcohol dehydrogenase